MLAHCDADAFFVGCELARYPSLKGKPVVVVEPLGSIILSKSLELKKMGITTGMVLWKAKKICQDLIAITTDFSWYQDCSQRFFEILKCWTPEVEIFSIDEAFLNLKGLRSLYHMNDLEMAYAIKEEIKEKLGFTVSIGISVNKTLAKMASEVNKPDGVSIIPKSLIAPWLRQYSVSHVPGIGQRSTHLLHQFGVSTCGDFIRLSEQRILKLLHRPGVFLWKELQGEKIFPLKISSAPQKMIMRTSSFSPVTLDQKFLWANTVQHLEQAVQVLEYTTQQCEEAVLYLRDKNFLRYFFKKRLLSPTSSFYSLLEILRHLWKEHFPKGKMFRSTGVILAGFSSHHHLQLSLFENSDCLIRGLPLEHAKERIRQRFGNNAIYAASTFRFRKAYQGEAFTKRRIKNFFRAGSESSVSGLVTKVPF